MPNEIPFVVPEEFVAALADQSIRRFGAILKDSATGQIVGHLQETGALEAARGSLLSLASGPVGWGAEVTKAGSAVVGVVQNEQIKRRIDEMQDMMGNLQSLQIASLATSLVGVGVTVASTAILLRRMSGLKARMEDIESRLDKLAGDMRGLGVMSTLDGLETALARLDEAPDHSDPAKVIARAEERLHDQATALANAMIRASELPALNPDFLRTLLQALALANAAQIRALIWQNETRVAARRADSQFDKIIGLSERLSRDRLVSRVADAGTRDAIAGSLSELRYRAAAQGSLGERLFAGDIHGRRYLEAAEAEDRHPLLVLQAA